MRGPVCILLSLAMLAGCVTARRGGVPVPWDARLTQLQRAATWHLEGRAAVAVDTQGWQASLDWRQRGADVEVRLAGPFGAGALTLTRTAAGLSLNGAPPDQAVEHQLQDKLGFELPLDELRYWLLGIPDPARPFEVTRNAEDRAAQLIQDGWTVVYARYAAVGGDVLPAQVVLSRAAARVRIVVDHWDAPR